MEESETAERKLNRPKSFAKSQQNVNKNKLFCFFLSSSPKSSALSTSVIIARLFVASFIVASKLSLVFLVLKC